jgi:ABC-type transport system involved in multi-copper enzyme maturation permease subunit
MDMGYIWKEWLEFSRGKAFWFFLILVIVTSFSVFLNTKGLPPDQGFEVFLLTLFEMDTYVIPLLCLFFASFSIIQEKELKTLIIILAKNDSYGRFLWKKSAAIQLLMMATFIIWYFILMIPVKFVFQFHLAHFFYFFLTIIILVLIFNQIGIFLGSICSTKIQLIGANIFALFFFIYLYDFILLYFLPKVTYENVKLFSLLYFLHPLHTLRFYLETSLGTFSLDYLSRTMAKFFSFPPSVLLAINIAFWVIITFFVSIWFYRKGEHE